MITFTKFLAKPIDGSTEIDTGQLEIKKDGRRIGWYRPGTPAALLTERFDNFAEIAAEIKVVRPDVAEVKQLPPAPEPVETAKTEDLF